MMSDYFRHARIVSRTLEWARRTFPHQPLVQVAGNHEFFGGCWQRVIEEMPSSLPCMRIVCVPVDWKNI